jgi:hypothetical protein
VGNVVIDAGGQAKPKADSTRFCGAMAEQRHTDGRGENESAPQKFVHLIGCRDPNAHKSWIRPGSISEKNERLTG